MKIALGTVQFGLDYGIANHAGRVQFEEARSILKLAAEHSIDTLDTAIAYGDSENTLGQVGVSHWQVVTKLSSVPVDCHDIVGWVESQIAGSLARLGINQLHGVLLHRPEQLFAENGSQIISALQNLKKRGLTQKIGVSIYAPNELEQLIQFMDLDLVQAPLSILDRRLIESGWAKRLKALGTELHVRSAFLQGLLLMPTNQRPPKFARWQPLWTEWERWLAESGLTPLQACIAYALGVEDIEKVVVGVDSVKQLQEILDATQSVLPNLPNWPQPTDSILITPSQWSQL
jgi:aryl-alcohol dehydrogenase-like predicted oxidoreductase